MKPPALCGLSVAVLKTDLLCQARWDVWAAFPLWLRWRMSCVGHFAAERPPVFVRPTLGAVSHQLYGFQTYAIEECLYA
jgi:hypothetical protein